MGSKESPAVRWKRYKRGRRAKLKRAAKINEPPLNKSYAKKCRKQKLRIKPVQKGDGDGRRKDEG